MKLSRQCVASLLCTVALLTGCSSTGTSETAYASDEVANPDEVTCKTVVKTGTRIGNRVCKTNRAWAAGNSSGRNMAESIQRTAGHTQGISGN